jgi:hypothetical protein
LPTIYLGQDPDPDPELDPDPDMDPDPDIFKSRIRIRSKIVRIRNTDCMSVKSRQWSIIPDCGATTLAATSMNYS